MRHRDGVSPAYFLRCLTGVSSRPSHGTEPIGSSRASRGECPPVEESPLPFPPRRPPPYADSMQRPHLLFVTGKLAEPSLRRTLEELAPRAGFDYSVAVLPITVIALATTPWIARHLTVPSGVDRVILPGLCLGDLEPVRALAAQV